MTHTPVPKFLFEGYFEEHIFGFEGTTYLLEVCSRLLTPTTRHDLGVGESSEEADFFSDFLTQKVFLT